MTYGACHGAENDDEYTMLSDAEERLLAKLGDEAEQLVIAIETTRRSRS